MLIKVKSAVSWMRARLSAISLADIQKHLAKIIILAPMAVLLIYLAIFSQPRYMSESKVAIKRSDDLNSGSLNFGLLLGASNPCIDSLEVRKKTGRTLDYSGSDGIRFGGACKPVAQILVVNQ